MKHTPGPWHIDLIASAPDILEALELLKSSYDFAKQEHGSDYVISEEDKRVIESAIKKAKGL